LAKTTSIWESECIHGTAYGSIKCCRVRVPTDCKQGWGGPSGSRMGKLRVLKLVRFFTQCEFVNRTQRKLWKPSEEPKTNFQVDRKLWFPTNGGSLVWLGWSTKSWRVRAKCCRMALMWRWSERRAPYLSAIFTSKSEHSQANTNEQIHYLTI
jgi:hypothetical protein